MKVSVIIPTRNRLEYIKNVVTDLKNQNNPVYEVIVVDQSDQPVQLNDCTYFHITSRGPCVSRNFGIDKATGDILVFLDDDLRLASDYIEVLVEPILEKKCNVVSGANFCPQGNYKFSRHGEHIETSSTSWIKSITFNPNCDSYGTSTLSFSGGCSAIKRAILDEVGYFDEFFDPSGAAEDRELAIRLFKHGHPIFYNGKAKMKHLGAEKEVGHFSHVRTVMLDVNLGYIVKKHFSEGLFKSYQKEITQLYRKKAVLAFFKINNFRERLALHRFVRKQFKAIKNK